MRNFLQPMFAPLMSLFRLVAGTDSNKIKVAIEYNNDEDFFCKVSSLATRLMLEHTLYLLRPCNTEIEKQQMVKLTSNYVSLEIELFELLVGYYEIMSNDTEADSLKIPKSKKQGKMLVEKYEEFVLAFYNLEGNLYDFSIEKMMVCSGAMSKILKAITKNIAESDKNKGDSRLLKELNLLVLVYKYRRLEHKHALQNIDFELSWELRDRINKIEEFISDNQDLFVKGVSIRDTIKALDIKPV